MAGNVQIQKTACAATRHASATTTGRRTAGSRRYMTISATIPAAWMASASLPIVVPSQLVSALPYLATIVVLVAISRDKVKIRLNAPACLGRPFHAAG